MQSRAKAFWEGARSGMRFGACAGVTIWLVIMVLSIAFVLLNAESRERTLRVWVEHSADHSALYNIGNSIAPFLLMIVYGAVPGAIIMGFANMLRRKHNESPESN